jgi:hypothetical protein
MSSLSRRYEILLPLQHNDGRPVEERLIGLTIQELRARFNAISVETQPIVGFWQHDDELYRDNLVRLFVDVPDQSEHRQFFVEYKKTLKERFEQLEIWITSYPLEVL